MTFSVQFGLQAEGDKANIVAVNRSDVDAALEHLLAAHRHYHNPTVFVRERPRFGPAEIPDHGLKMDLSRPHCVGALAYFGAVEGEPNGGGAFITLTTDPIEDTPTLYRDLDSATPFPANAVIPLDQLREALYEFLERGGKRPTCVQWQPAEAW